MIKQYNYKNGSRSVTAEFGKGDLLVSSIIDENLNRTGIVIFNNKIEEQIGTPHKGNKGKLVSEVCEESIILNFTKYESIDIVIKYLKEAKKSLLILNKK